MVAESYWRALCLTLGVAIGYVTFSAPPTVHISIQLEVPRAPIRAPDWGEREATCLAHVVYNEARNQGDAGQIAVAATVINRALDDRWPDSICKVAKQKHQFAAWKPNPRNAVDRRALRHAHNLAVYTLNNYHRIDTELRSFLYFNSGRARSNAVATIGDHHFGVTYT